MRFADYLGFVEGSLESRLVATGDDGEFVDFLVLTIAAVVVRIKISDMRAFDKVIPPESIAATRAAANARRAAAL